MHTEYTPPPSPRPRSSRSHTLRFTHPVCWRHVNLLVYSLSLHRHSYIGFILAFTSSIHNKQQLLVLWFLVCLTKTRTSFCATTVGFTRTTQCIRDCIETFRSPDYTQYVFNVSNLLVGSVLFNRSNPLQRNYLCFS